ncbi:CbiO3 [Desulforapulum autotrophicum HRM2]|uniref:CbiO3 n=1 Tax=Desulforapulum autotrophicum (strain ATCC 43914 / DSM 3382 / VKM B-1955 / HRM2) TaxID=177437 RepID=C0QHB7_DESAH|nr:ABC transporter ATP-binding protein [Desulforapulum autotrophicum]ACN17776.1 CbiO3 [Desulforapulum autotrophicum HRM2]
MTQSGIEIENLSYHYPGTANASLKNVSLKISNGEFAAIIGGNNSGKSTLCHAISGIVPHLYHGRIQGRIRVNGTDISTMDMGEIAQDVGMVMQIPRNQLSGFCYTVFEEVALGLENQGLQKEKIIHRVQRVLGMTGLEDLAQRSPHQLSGGQQQRLILAVAIALEPSFLVLDEPTTFLDPMGAKEVFNLLHKLNKKGTTIIIAEQRLEFIAEYAGRVIVLKDGATVLDGSAQEILTSPVLKEVNMEWTRFTRVAALARTKGLWTAGEPLSASFSTTIKGLTKK